jgi:hypothetical protein
MGFDKLSPNGITQPFALSRGLSLSKAPCRRVCEVREEGFDKLGPNGFSISLHLSPASKAP